MISSEKTFDEFELTFDRHFHGNTAIGRQFYGGPTLYVTLERDLELEGLALNTAMFLRSKTPYCELHPQRSLIVRLIYLNTPVILHGLPLRKALLATLCEIENDLVINQCDLNILTANRKVRAFFVISCLNI